MKFLRDALDGIKPNFEKGGKWEKFYYVYEAHETLLFKPKDTTGPKGAHIRDGADLKRTMMTVIIALIPCLLFGIYNAGYQHYLALGQDASLMEMILVGAKLVLPIVAVSYASGLGIEFVFATIRRHDVNEGFLVSGMLIPLVLPPTTPLWMVALGTVFAVVFGKEVFGGTGMNLLNPALTARAFLFFAYPAQLSGEVWTYLGEQGSKLVDNYSGATALSLAADTLKRGDDGKFLVGSVTEAFEAFWNPEMFSLKSLFIGTVPGSIGETSALMCIIGAVVLILTGVGSWRIMLSMVIGGLVMGYIFNAADANPYMGLSPVYHLVMGGFAFGAVFMATDPVSASQTATGKYIYGFLCGFFAIMIRVFNPAYPEGVMLAILLMNVFAPLIDYVIVEQNKKRRLSRATV